MITISVPASRQYDVLIGSGLLSSTGKYLSSFQKPCKTAIISDTNVWPLYGETVKVSLEKQGFEVFPFVFSAGEESKNSSTYLLILDFLAKNYITRSDCIIALGGGVVGDISGFTAATYLRGIPYIQIPTTLLAMVDSSVGGKTAIDLPAGKNLVGAFYQPSVVLCDIDTLLSLSEAVFRDGCAEVIKYGILYDPQLFEHLDAYGLDFDREYVISRCVELKRNVVAVDEFDRGDRQKLNLGHTIGHSIEAQSHFTISHGQAVSIGMNIVSKAAAAKGICSNATSSAIQSITEKFQLPQHTAYKAHDLFEASLSDKKRLGKTVTLIVPKAIGDCILLPTPVSELQSFIEAGL